MKRILATVSALSLFSIGLVGCAEKSSTTTETKKVTPGGTTTTTTTREVEKTGKNPPSERP